MKKILKNSLWAALTLGLMSGSAIAHEQQYDNTKEPSDSPHKAEPPKGGHSSLSSAATNPIANLIQFQIQDAYTPSNNNASGSSNTFILQPVIPIKLSWEAVPLMVTRTTLPYINTPDLGDGIGTQEGFGDIAQQGFLIPKLETKGVMVAFGYNLIIPTGGDNEFVGSGKWSIGPGAAYINLQTPTWQWGLFGYSAFDFANQDSSRSHVASVSIQPLLIKHFDKGWYAGLPDVPFVHDFKTDNWTTAWGGRVGKVTKFGKQPVNLFGQATYNSVDEDDEVSPEWTYKVNMTFLFPG